MSAEQATILTSVDGADVPLRGVSAHGRLNGLLFELTVEQTWENTGKTNIEGVYTFPVPHCAVLLGLDLEIGDRKLSGVVVRKQVASAKYEAAMDGGNSAALLEQAGAGLYTLSLGNLLAGETAVIRYRYAEILDRHTSGGSDGYVRLCVPTVIAPRYGDPATHGVQPHQAPGVDLLASYPFALTIDVQGDQARAELSSPSHRITVSGTPDGKRITLGPGAWLDRDFILQLTGAVTAAASITARDGDGYVSLVSLDPQLQEEALRSLCLKIVVDCSGSMGGDSIAQARRALLAVLDRLQPKDTVSLTRFGSSVEHLAGPTTLGARLLREFMSKPGEPRTAAPGEARMLAASPSTVEWLKHAVREMDADLGGTELARALEAAIAIWDNWDHDPRDLLLITDGEVWALESVVDLATRSDHRLFVVAVGSAPAEALARSLSEKTGGAVEFVSPNEDIEGAIVRMFRRLREAPKRITAVDWPVAPEWTAPLPAMVFSGDTQHLLAGFRANPVGDVRITISGAARGKIQLRRAVSAAVDLDILPRVAAARRLASLKEEEAGALAEQYQLASRHTSFVVVQVRAKGEKAETLPALKAVGQMLAAGWGAAGSVSCDLAADPSPNLTLAQAIGRPDRRAMTIVVESTDCENALESTRTNGGTVSRDDYRPELLDDEVDGDLIRSPRELLAEISSFTNLGHSWPTTLTGLHELGLPAELLEQLGMVIESGDHEESDAVRVYIALLARSPAGANLSAKKRAALIGTVFGDRDMRTLRMAIEPLVVNATADAWGTSLSPAQDLASREPSP